MDVIETKHVLQHRYGSLGEFSDYQRANQKLAYIRQSFTGVDSLTEACDRANAGLPAVGLRVLDTSKALTDTAMRTIHTLETYDEYGVAGGYVDMGRFVTGEPECMIETMFDTTPVEKPVVTIVSNVNASGGINKSDLEERGRLVVALIRAVETSGRSTELWVDSTNIGRGVGREHAFRISVKIKDASQPLDMGAVMYAFSDPSMLRALCFNAMHRLPSNWQPKYGVGGSYGCVPEGAVRAEESYGAGCVYLPAVRLGENGVAKVTKVLRELGIS